MEYKEFKIIATYATDGAEIELEYTEYNIQAVRMAYGNGVFSKYTLERRSN
jgi:hypothetical protein